MNLGKYCIILLVLVFFAPKLDGQVSASLSHTFTTESDVWTNSRTVTITLTGDTLVALIATDNAAASQFLSGFSGGSTAFQALISSMDETNISLSDADTVAIITFPVATTYFIGENDTIDFSIPSDAMKNSVSNVDADQQLIIENEEPVLSITNESFSEESIRSTSQNFTISLVGDLFAASLSADFQDRIINNTGTQWDLLIRDNLSISRTGDQLITVTIPATPSWDISAEETIGLSVLAADLQYTVEPASLVASGEKTLTLATPTVSASATFNGVGEGDIRLNSYTITLTLNDGSWHSDIGNDNLTNRNFIEGLSFTPAEASALSAMTDAILQGNNDGADNTSVSGNTVTITVPAVPLFNLLSTVNVSYLVPAAAINETSSDINSGIFAGISHIEPYVEIGLPQDPVNSSDLNGMILGVKLYEDTWDNPTFDRTNFTFEWDPADTATIDIASNGDINQVSSDSLTIVLRSYNTVKSNKHFSLIIAPAELQNSTIPLQSPVPGIEVIAIIDPIITDVSIPNEGMAIGETVQATLTVDDDTGQAFSLLGGSIAGRNVYGLSRINSTTYRVNFDVGSAGTSPEYGPDQDIPYTNLQLQNGILAGRSYSGLIVQDQDTLDTSRPLASLVTVNSGSYNIGDQVVINLQSAEDNLRIDGNLSSVNSISTNSTAITVLNSGSGFYQVFYNISQGDDDVPAGNDLPINLVLVDAVGNRSLPIVAYSGTDPVIDANAPAIISVDETSTGTIIPGQEVIYTIVAGESGLVLAPGTEVNNIPGESSRIYLSGAGNTYELHYEVAESDADVNAGNLIINLVLADQAGNTTTFTGTVSNRDLSINTSLPFANLSGPDELCKGDSARLVLEVSGGVGPYEVTILRNGTAYDTLQVIENTEYEFFVQPTENSTYLVFQIIDAVGNSEHTFEDHEISVYDLPNVAFAADIQKVFSFEDGGAFLLEATPVGGTFSGPGVVPSENSFYPGIVGVKDSLEILYTYEAPATGCVNRDTVYFEVLEASGTLTVYYPDPQRDGIVCFNDSPVKVSGKNIGTDVGTFALYREKDTLSMAVAIIDDVPGDSIIFIDPSLLDKESGEYWIQYEYTWEKSTFKLKEFIDFDFIPDITFPRSIPASLCRNNPQEDLSASPFLNGTFDFESIAGVSGDEDNGFVFDPSEGLIGDNVITYTYISNTGCIQTDQLTIEVFDIPDIAFYPDDVCITKDLGSNVHFQNLTQKTDLVLEWRWDYDDDDVTVQENFDTIPGDNSAIDVDHFYKQSGRRTVSLEVQTKDLCVSTVDSIFDFNDKPTASYKLLSPCWLPGDPMKFKNTSSSRSNSHWNIYALDYSWDTSFYDSDSIIEIYFNSSSVDYMVEIEVSTTEGLFQCSDTYTGDVLEINRTQEFEGADSRFMTFDNGDNEKWHAQSTDGFASWVVGIPDFMGFEGESSDQSWYTQRSSNKREENSWIQSQCFDLRELEKPMIRMDIMRSFDETRDGAVLQYTTDNGENWVTIGNIGEGINWYNTFDIVNRPGGGESGVGSSIGWSNAVDSSWVTVAHDLDALLVNPDINQVIFGIFYSTDDDTLGNNQGFAVDNIYIGERKKHALLEYFTNAGDSQSGISDLDISSFEENNALDVTGLHYHMNYPGVDPFNEIYPVPASARSIYYGINEVPYAYLDGGTTSDFQFDLPSEKPGPLELRKLTLESPVFDLDLKYQLYQATGDLSATIDMTALEDIDFDQINLYLAIVNKRDSIVVGGVKKEYRNIVMKMLPDAAGTAVSQQWSRGDSYQEVLHWKPEESILNKELKLVAFLQDRISGKILQVATRDTTIFPLGNFIEEAGSDMKVYPNPVSEMLKVHVPVPAQEACSLELLDMTGRLIKSQHIPQGLEEVQIDMSDLQNGHYLLLWKEAGSLKYRSQVLKL